MSQAVALRSAGPATQVMRRTETDVKKWLTDVLDGTGSSPAQMVITVVLGCIPYVGQAIDARNIVIGIIDVSDEPDNTEKWIDLVLSLVALVPLFGDALKNVFKMLRLGKPLGRILDALPNQLRGNVERWFQTLNWAQYTHEVSALADNILGKLVNLLDGWVSRAVMGNARVRQVVGQLERVQSMAQRKIDEVMKGLEESYRKALHDPLPTTTAKAPAARAPKAPPPGSSAAASVKTTSGGNPTPAQGSGGGGHRQSPPRRTNAQIGASGEHICDYYFVKRNKTRAKVNHRGLLYEYQQPGHHGIDHVWHHAGLPFKYRITDTKATGKGWQKQLMNPKAAFDALRMGVDVYLGADDPDNKRVGAAVGTTRNDGVQLSHLWVARKVSGAGLLKQHTSHLVNAIKTWEAAKFKPATEVRLENGEPKRVAVRCPYDRSLVTVIGANLDRHDQAKGGDLPQCSRPVKVHQIAAEFVMPTEMLER
jgi:hypothetical protein